MDDREICICKTLQIRCAHLVYRYKAFLKVAMTKFGQFFGYACPVSSMNSKQFQNVM